MKYKIRRKKKLKSWHIILLLIILLLSISSSYAIFTTQLVINGTVSGEQEQFDIFYVGFDNSSSFPSSIGYMDTYTYTFSSTPTIQSVSMDGVTLTQNTDYTYTNGTLTITNVTGDLLITAGSSGGTTYTDTTTTTYDPEDLPTDSTIIFENISGKPEVTTDSDGNVTSFEYTDTGANGVTLQSGGLDTGVLAFDGRDFVVTLKANLTFSNCTKTIAPIINITEKGKTVNGILIYEARSTSGYANNESGARVNTPYNKFRFGRYEHNNANGSVDFNIASKVTTNSGLGGRYGYNASNSPITLTFKLYCTNGAFTAEIYNAAGTLIAKPYNNTTMSFNNTGSDFENITIELGTFVSNNNASYKHTFDILEFSVVKL